jgi:prophage tail gpP-like protein
MSKKYVIQQGDTLSLISRKRYGTEDQVENLIKANPGLTEPLRPLTTIIIPDRPQAPKNKPQVVPSNDINEVSIVIDGQRFRFWDRFRITRSIDSIDTMQFSAPFDSSNVEFVEKFRPFSYKDVSVNVGGRRLFTGTMLSIDPDVEPEKKIVLVSCYSTPGVLNDCTMPSSSFPLEFDNQGLRDIAKSLCLPFGIEVSFAEDQGAVFERVALEPGSKVLPFLIKLAQQRNLVIGSTDSGGVEFRRSQDKGQILANFAQGQSPLISVKAQFSPQEYYSHITGLEPTIVGLKGSQFTVKNERLDAKLRPFTFEVTDTLDADVKEAVNSKASRMFANMASYSITVSSWRDSFGDLWKPNTFINLVAPDAMIYNKFKFLVRSVDFDKDAEKETATINLVIPGSFSGKISESLPWDL